MFENLWRRCARTERAHLPCACVSRDLVTDGWTDKRLDGLSIDKGKGTQGRYNAAIASALFYATLITHTHRSRPAEPADNAGGARGSDHWRRPKRGIIEIASLHYPGPGYGSGWKGSKGSHVKVEAGQIRTASQTKVYSGTNRTHNRTAVRYLPSRATS